MIVHEKVNFMVMFKNKNKNLARIQHNYNCKVAISVSVAIIFGGTVAFLCESLKTWDKKIGFICTGSYIQMSLCK